MRCPNCQSFDLRRSYPAGLMDALMKSSGRDPVRCRRCSYRFHHKLQPGEVLGLPDPPLHPVEPITVPAKQPDTVLDPERTVDSVRK